jgi:hypothetical protein
MRRLRYRALHVEVKDRLGAPGTYLCDSPQGRPARTRSSVAAIAIANKIHIGVLLIGRPVALEIVKEHAPIGSEPVFLEVLQRKRKTVVDANQRWRFPG